jgi:hypothetical protein
MLGYVFRQDYIKRLIERLGEFLARLSSLAAQGKYQEADRELQQAEGAIGLPLGSERLDARSLVIVLGGDRSVLWALVLEQRARLCESRGEAALARRHAARAKEILSFARSETLREEERSLRERLIDHSGR